MNDLPKNWVIKRVKEIANWQTGFTPDTKKLEYYDGNDEWVTIGDLDKGFLKPSKNKIRGDLFPKSWITPENSLLFSFKLSIGQVAFNKNKVYTNEAICAFTPDSLINLRYFYYAAPYFIVKNANKNIYGADLLNQELIANALVFVPPKEQQITIAHYLDLETSKIDRKISILEQKFETLEEYRQSVIFETVTKGLDRNVPMKDSGIDWIGDIPEHWEVKRVKDILSLRGGGADKKTIEGEQMVNLVNFVDVFKKIPLNNNQEYMKVSCPVHKVIDISLRKNDILITPSSETPKEIGLANIVLEDLINTVFSYHILRLRTTSKSLNPQYVYYYFNSNLAAIQFEEKAMGTTRVTLSRYDILSNVIFFPPHDEQNSLVNYLDEFSNKINNKKEIIKKQINLLKELKQSIIFEAVTGKLN